MSVMSELDKAQGGQLYRKLGEMGGLAPSDARRVMEGFCPSIAARLMERTRDREGYEKLLELLDDNEGDLIAGGGEVGDEDVLEDGLAVLADIYGSERQAREEAMAVAEALRIESRAAEQLHPIAAALVLSILSRRYQQEEDREEETETGDTASAKAAEGRPGIIGIVLAAIGGAIMRALVRQLAPRRRRTRARFGRAPSRRRRPRRREPRLEDLFRDLMR